MQCLYVSCQFRSSVTACLYSMTSHFDDDHDPKECLVCLIAAMLIGVSRHQIAYIEPTVFCKIIGHKFLEDWRFGVQQDSTEFFIRITTELSKSNVGREVLKCCSFTVDYELSCSACGHKKRNEASPDTILSLGLKGDLVQECLLNEMDWESLEEYKCDECDARDTTSRRGFLMLTWEMKILVSWSFQ